jgi:[acyl-carrier-protein] S-malonyltransferase
VSLGVLFPGQGSQFVGMGADLFEARPDLLGDAANDVLGFDLRKMCLDGSEEELTRTEHAQPALFALSFALWDELRRSLEITPSGMAGHSLGEYTALTAANALDFASSLGVVALRGRAMAAAADAEPSGMAALIGADEGLAQSVCAVRREMGGRLQVANINSPGQIVVAGGAGDIEWLAEEGRDHGIRRVIPLKVAGAFHSSFMASASEAVADGLAMVEIRDPDVPVWANATALPHEESAIVSVLARQVVEPVRFMEILQNMGQSGISTYVHVGPGDVTAGLVRKTLPDAEVMVVSSIEDIGGVVDVLGTMVQR